VVLIVGFRLHLGWCPVLIVGCRLHLGSFQAFLAFLGAFEKLRKASISFVMYVRPPTRPEQLGCHWTDLNEIWYWRIF
jgi:hypothetical protein